MNIYEKYNNILILNLIISINKYKKINLTFDIEILNNMNINYIINFINFINVKIYYNIFYFIFNKNLINIIKFGAKHNILSNYNKKKYFKIINFANTNNVNLDNLKVHKDTFYSITPYTEASYISNLIYKYHKENKNIIITDSTANVGGNTISFGLFKYKLINAVEVNKKCYECLCNNVCCYNLKNIKIFNNNYLDVYKKLYQDVLFIDPPWGGPNYKNIENLQLYLDNKNVVDLICEVFNDTVTTSIILKAPFNFNKNYLQLKCKDLKNIEIKYYNLNKFIIIYLFRKLKN